MIINAINLCILVWNLLSSDHGGPIFTLFLLLDSERSEKAR